MVKGHGWISTKNSSYVARPATVTLISLLQFVKAALILYVAWRTWDEAPVTWGSRALWQTIFVVTNGRVGPIFVHISPFIALYSFAAGCGLLLLQKWARKALLTTCALNAFYWVLAMALSSWNFDLGLRLSQPGFDQQGVAILVFLDVMIFLCLAWGRNVPEAFAQYA